MGAEDERRLAGIALRQERTQHSGEHIAHAGARHAGIAAGVDEPVAIACGKDAAIALQHDVRIQVFAKRARRLHAIGLDVRRAFGEEARRFRRVRRDDRFGVAPGASVAQVFALGNEVERIGVEHARQLARERRADQRLRALALAEPRPDDKRIEVLSERIVGMAQHQLGRHRIDREHRVEQTHVHAARAELERGAPREERRAAHAGCAAEDAERAGLALVEVPRPGFEHIAEKIGRCHPRRGSRRRKAEIGDADLAATVGTVEREQSGLEADEGDGVRRPDSVSHHATGVRMQSARDVQREHRAVLAIDVVDEPCRIALHIARQADPEEAVDDESPRLVFRKASGVEQRDPEELLA